MKALRVKLLSASFALVLFAGAAITFSMTSGAAPVWAFSEQSGNLHVTKECSQYTGAPGSFCTNAHDGVSPTFVAFEQLKRLERAFELDDIELQALDAGVTLLDDIERVLAGEGPLKVQHPSMGCSIKWKEKKQS